MGAIGTGELLLIFFVVLLVFGAKRIPEIARHMGTAITEFRSSAREIRRQLDLSDTQSNRPARHYGTVPTPPASAPMPDDLSPSAPPPAVDTPSEFRSTDNA